MRNDELIPSISAYNLLELNGDSNIVTASLQDRKVSKAIQQVMFIRLIDNKVCRFFSKHFLINFR